MSTIQPTEIEKENLEAHVQLSWERYKRLEEQFYDIDEKVETLTKELRIMRDEYMVEIREMREENSQDNRSLKTAVLTSSATVMAALIGFVAMVWKI